MTGGWLGIVALDRGVGGASSASTHGSCDPVVLNSCISPSRAGGRRARLLDSVRGSCWETLGRFISPAGPLEGLGAGEAYCVETGAQRGGSSGRTPSLDVEAPGWGLPGRREFL